MMEGLFEMYHLNERGVSETLGFIIIFGIMLTGIAMVSLYGYPMLVQQQQNTNIRNMERNMIVLQNDLNGLTYKNVPYQETMIQVSGGTMIIPEDGGLYSTFEIDTDADGNPEYTFPTGGITFTSQDTATTICLENGAVHTRFWGSPNGSAMLSEPRWFYDDPTKTFVMSFITMNATDYFAQTGIGTVRIMLINSTQYPPVNVSGPGNVTVKYTGSMQNNYNIAWRNYFESDALRMNPSGPQTSLESTYTLPSSATTLIIKTYNVTVLSL